jgi:hypothetical protein
MCFATGLISALSVITQASFAAYASLPADVLAEISTNVGFAPEKDRGMYRFQILATGEVRKVDNKGNVKSLAILSEALMSTLSTAIENVQYEGLNEATGTRCFDAPSQAVQVRNTSTQETVLVQTRIACQMADAKNAKARLVADAIRQLENAFRSVEQVKR